MKQMRFWYTVKWALQLGIQVVPLYGFTDYYGDEEVIKTIQLHVNILCFNIVFVVWVRD